MAKGRQTTLDEHIAEALEKKGVEVVDLIRKEDLAFYITEDSFAMDPSKLFKVPLAILEDAKEALDDILEEKKKYNE